MGAELEVADLTLCEFSRGLEAELDAGGFADVIDEDGAKAGDTGSTGTADARIDNAI